MDSGKARYEISAAYMTDKGLTVRLFNPSDTKSAGTVRFGIPVREIIETDLNGNPVGKPETAVRKRATEMDAEIPPFGIRTYLIRL